MLTVQWAQVAPGAVVETTATGARLRARRPFDDPCGAPMPDGPGPIDTTVKLLDGALLIAEKVATRDGRPSVRMTPLRHAWRLVGSYHSTHATPRIMARARERFAALGRADLAAFAAEKVAEESGHDELALADLRALGYDGESLVAALVPPAAAALVAAEERAVEGDDPLASLGYAYAIERSCTRLGAGYVRAVEEMLGDDVHATRCLRVHSALGEDAEHVERAVRFIASLSGPERGRIAAAVYEAGLVIYGSHEGQHPADSELAELLSGYRASLSPPAPSGSEAACARAAAAAG